MHQLNHPSNFSCECKLYEYNCFAKIFIHKYGRSFTCQGISLNKIEHVNNMINICLVIKYLTFSHGFAQCLHSMSDNGACHEGYLSAKTPLGGYYQTYNQILYHLLFSPPSRVTSHIHPCNKYM